MATCTKLICHFVNIWILRLDNNVLCHSLAVLHFPKIYHFILKGPGNSDSEYHFQQKSGSEMVNHASSVESITQYPYTATYTQCWHRMGMVFFFKQKVYVL